MTRKQLVALICAMYPFADKHSSGKISLHAYSKLADISGHNEDRLFFDSWNDDEDPFEDIVIKYDYRLERLSKQVLMRFIVRNYPFFLQRLERAGEEFVDTDIVIGVQQCRMELAVREIPVQPSPRLCALTSKEVLSQAVDSVVSEALTGKVSQ